jgi:hypothetical protein
VCVSVCVCVCACVCVCVCARVCVLMEISKMEWFGRLVIAIKYSIWSHSRFGCTVFAELR